MPATVRADNFAEANLGETTIVDAAALAAATALQVRSTQGISANDFVLVGPPGAEGTELRQVSAVPDATHLTISALALPHGRNEPVTVLKGNQIKLYRAAAPSNNNPPLDSAYGAAQATVSIDPDQFYTDWTDATGGTGFWYKYTYYNSTSLAETPLADAIPERGEGYGHYASIGQIRRSAGLKQAKQLSDTIIAEYRQNAENEVDGWLEGTYALPFTPPIPGIINNVTRMLAAGYLMNDELGQSAQGVGAGDSRIKQGHDLLAAIKSGTANVVGADRVDETTASGARVHGFPVQSDYDDPTENLPAPASVTDKF